MTSYPVRNVTVYCSSSDSVDELYFAAARELGEGLARRRMSLVFGGCAVGLMGAVASSAKQHGGEVVGVIPEAIHRKGITAKDLHELVITTGMRERKAIMESRADAFIALPGGFGTLEELLEILTLKQLQYHSKPLVMLNVNGFFDPLRTLFDHVLNSGFAKPVYRQLYHFSDSVADVFGYLDSYVAPVMPTKWTAEVCEAE